MDDGIYTDIPFGDYLRIPGFSVSAMKLFARAPALIQREPPPETGALRKGTIIHCAILEGEDLERRYYPVADTTRMGSKAWDLAEVKAAGRIVVKQGEYDMAQRVRDSVQRHPSARALLSPGLLVEQTIIWTDPETGVKLKGRADGIRADWHVMVDVKSTENAHPDAFTRAIASYLYHLQQAHYEDGVACAAGWEPEQFVFIAVEKDSPYLVGAYVLDRYDVDRAREAVREHIRHYARCEQANSWPGYSDEVELLTLPAWAHGHRQ